VERNERMRGEVERNERLKVRKRKKRRYER
jgi:hypothetical protein